MTAFDAKQMVEKGDIFLLDVRTPAEYELGHIERAVLIPLKNVPADSTALSPEELLPARMKELPRNKNTEILVIVR